MAEDQRDFAPVELFHRALVIAAEAGSLPAGAASELRRAAALRLFTTIEQLLGLLVVRADVEWERRPRTFAEMATALYERDLIPSALYIELENLASARNLLAHGGTSEMSADDFGTLEATARRFLEWHLVKSPSGPKLSPAAANARLAARRDDSRPRRNRRVFICYAAEDRRAADNIYDRLKTRGHTPWMDKRSLLPGQVWETEIEAAIRQADAFVACLSMKSISKRSFLQKEIRFALDVLGTLPPGHIYLIPLLLEACTPPPHLQSLHWLDWSAAGAEAQLYAAIEHRGSG